MRWLHVHPPMHRSLHALRTHLQAGVRAHGPQALVPLQRHQELEAPDEGLVGQRLHACLGGMYAMMMIRHESVLLAHAMQTAGAATHQGYGAHPGA